MSMNRRDFGKIALGAAGTAWAAPRVNSVVKDLSAFRKVRTFESDSFDKNVELQCGGIAIDSVARAAVCTRLCSECYRGRKMDC